MLLKYLPLFVSTLIAPNLANADVPIEAGIVSVFDTLKIYAWIVIVVVAFMGAFVYVYRRKRMLSTRLIGLVVSFFPLFCFGLCRC